MDSMVKQSLASALILFGLIADHQAATASSSVDSAEVGRVGQPFQTAQLLPKPLTSATVTSIDATIATSAEYPADYPPSTVILLHESQLEAGIAVELPTPQSMSLSQRHRTKLSPLQTCQSHQSCRLRAWMKLSENLWSCRRLRVMEK